MQPIGLVPINHFMSEIGEQYLNKYREIRDFKCENFKETLRKLKSNVQLSIQSTIVESQEYITGFKTIRWCISSNNDYFEIYLHHYNKLEIYVQPDVTCDYEKIISLAYEIIF